jgi:FKBP-type peptidyl-prolyl cis-trans isomerase
MISNLSTMTTMMKFFLTACLALGSTLAFAPSRSFQRGATSVFSSADDFSSYSTTDPLQQLAYKDTLVGTGDAIEKGKVVTIAYQGRLMSNGRKFDEGNGYSFRLGEGKVIPGWEIGLLVG